MLNDILNKVWHLHNFSILLRSIKIKYYGSFLIDERLPSSFKEIEQANYTKKTPFLTHCLSLRYCHTWVVKKKIFLNFSLWSYYCTDLFPHSMATANLKKSSAFMTNTTAASKYTPRRPRISINWNPPFQTSLHKISKEVFLD